MTVLTAADIDALHDASYWLTQEGYKNLATKIDQIVAKHYRTSFPETAVTTRKGYSSSCHPNEGGCC